MSPDFQLFLFSMALAFCLVATVNFVYDLIMAKGTDQLAHGILAVLCLGIGLYLILHDMRGLLYER